jgi:hypothetical protein
MIAQSVPIINSTGFAPAFCLTCDLVELIAAKHARDLANNSRNLQDAAISG